jgi:hypothetical protein
VKDWIALYKSGVSGPPVSRQYTGGGTSGSLSFTAPSEPGEYFFIYYLNDSFTVATGSGLITVTPRRSLTATPSFLSPGANVTVNWIAPPGSSATDWIGLYAVGAPNCPSIRWRYTGGAASGSFTEPAPSQPGQYEYRYFLNNGYTPAIKTSTITVASVTTPTHTLTASPSFAPPGTSVAVSWTAPPGSSATDWIGMYRLGQPDHLPRVRQYTGGVASGSLTFALLPFETGEFEFRYFINDTFTLTVKSQVVTATYDLSPPPPYRLWFDVSSTTGEITVTWIAPQGSSPTDWVGLFFHRAPGTSPVSWRYTGGAPSGTINIPKPAGSGYYEVRYLRNDSYTDVAARSHAFQLIGSYGVSVTPQAVGAGGSLTVTWYAPPGRPYTDWIGLYLIGAPNRPALWWQYTNGGTSGTCTAPAPSTPGDYELRYLLNDTYTDIPQRLGDARPLIGGLSSSSSQVRNLPPSTSASNRAHGRFATVLRRRNFHISVARRKGGYAWCIVSQSPFRLEGELSCIDISPAFFRSARPSFGSQRLVLLKPTTEPSLAA